jgi:acetolactate synthase-1/2/3 large subunit
LPAPNTGADSLVQFLKSKRVSTIFSISGAGNLAILDAISRDGSINVIFSHHEQAAVMEAQGYARASGNPGVALLTTGGGISNGTTGILSAFLDSVSVFVISGNESSFHFESSREMRAIGVQGFDSVKVLTPVSKKATRIMSLNALSYSLENLWSEMIADRRGPVFLDFPMDLQRQGCDEKSMTPNINRAQDISKRTLTQIEKSKIVKDLKNSNFPVLYIGNGCRDESTLKLLREFITKLDIPYILSWSAIDLFPDSDPLNIGRAGIYGDRATNILLQRSDLLITIGTRLAIPQVGYDKKDFARKALKWVVEIDASECKKFPEDWSILNMSSLDFMTELSGLPLNEGLPKKNILWREIVSNVWKELPRRNQAGDNVKNSGDHVHSLDVMSYLNESLDQDATVVTDVGAGLLSGHYMISPKNQRIFTSQGLGEMGFGLPGAIGAHFAKPKNQIVCLNTDGAIMFNLQELQLVKHHKIPIKLFVFNNFGYAMIKVSQDNLFASRQVGSGLENGISFPDFRKIAELFEMSHYEVKNNSSLNKELTELLSDSRPALIEVIMSPEQKYLPRLGTTKLPDGTLISPPIEDMEPLIPLDLLEKLLGYEPTKSSRDLRMTSR